MYSLKLLLNKMSSNKWVTASTLINGVVTFCILMLIEHFTITKKQQVIN